MIASLMLMATAVTFGMFFLQLAVDWMANSMMASQSNYQMLLSMMHTDLQRVGYP